MENGELIKKPTFISQPCIEQLEEAYDYMAAKSPMQAEIMHKQFSKIRKIIGVLPGIGVPYKNGIRYLGFGKFRYNIYYREKEDLVEILGIWHTSRGTGFEEV